MMRWLVGLMLVVGAAVTVPFAGYLTARNAATCGLGFILQGPGPVAVSDPAARFEARIATWNAEYTNTTGGVLYGLREIGDHADVIGIQELTPTGRRRVVAVRLGSTWGISAGDNAVQILWRKSRYDLLAQGSQQVFGIESMEPGVAGTSIGPKSVQWVQLRDKTTGAVIFVVNHHIVPGIEDHGRPDRTRPRRLALYDRQMSALLGVVAALRSYGPVFTTGDLNIDERLDAHVQDPSFPYARMGAAGLTSNWQTLGYPAAGTHAGGRLIDAVWATTANATFTSQRMLPRYGSDHRAVVAIAHDSFEHASINTADYAATSQDGAVPKQLTVPGPVPETSMRLGGEQATIAADIIKIGETYAIPARGWVVALAAALQESGLRNLHYGDRDSLGVFQQRPSSGWGAPTEITDADLAIRAFYGVADHTHNPGLIDISGWQTMSVAQAAQAVQRSAFPDAYAKWEPAAQSIAQQLAGVAPGPAPTGCGTPETTVGDCPPSRLAAEQGLTPDALLVLRCGHAQFPQITSIGGVRPDPLPDHPSGHAVDFMIPNYKSIAGNAFGWQVAHWMRDHHAELGVQYVIFDAKIWNVLRDAEGWRDYHSVTGSINDSSMHYNHVHVTVFGDKANGHPGAAEGSERWVMLLPTGTTISAAPLADIPAAEPSR